MRTKSASTPLSKQQSYAGKNFLTERAVLAGIVKQKFDDSPALELGPEHFADPFHRKIFTILKKFRQSDQPPSIVGVYDELGGDLDEVQKQLLNDLDDGLWEMRNAKEMATHAETLRRNKLLFEVKLASEEVAQGNTDKDDPALLRLYESLGKHFAKPDDRSAEPIKEVMRPDIPDSVLCGRLGEIISKRMRDFPLAYSYLSLTSCAGTMVRPGNSPIRTNAYNVVVGEKGSGKGSAFERAVFLTSIDKQTSPPLLSRLMAGSAEGLLEKVGNRNGENVLYYPDELKHLFDKAAIKNSSFYSIMNSLFYSDTGALTVARGRTIAYDLRLSIFGGIVEDDFGDCFGAASVTGTYDRCSFGLCPGNFRYLHRPNEGGPALDPFFDRPGAPGVDPEVWEARDSFVKEEDIHPRLAEIGLRAAVVHAAFDGVQTLTAKYLPPFWEFVRYQKRVRLALEPNTGLNFDARFAQRLLQFLKSNAPKGERLKLRDVLRGTHASQFGPTIIDRVTSSLRFAGEIEIDEGKTDSGQKTKTIRLIQGVTDAL
jgi:hypothetical protein